MNAIVIPTWRKDRSETRVKNWNRLVVGPLDCRVDLSTSHKLGTLQAMALGADRVLYSDIIGFAHDDVEILDSDWEEKVEAVFEQHPECGLVGFGGATGFGSRDIYCKPYDLMQLIRYEFVSNMVEWETHGALRTTPTQVMFLDGFSLFFRRQCYRHIGGWRAVIDMGMGPHHAYDLVASIEVARRGWEIWMVPVKCHHQGGRTGTTEEYNLWLRGQGWESNQSLFEHNHRIAYERGRGVLPLRAHR